MEVHQEVRIPLVYFVPLSPSPFLKLTQVKWVILEIVGTNQGLTFSRCLEEELSNLKLRHNLLMWASNLRLPLYVFCVADVSDSEDNW